MVGELVRYNNKLNGMSVRKWSSAEMNLFFAIIAKIKNSKPEQTSVVLSFDEILKLSDFDNSHPTRFAKLIDEFSDKALSLVWVKKYDNDEGGSFSKLALFQRFDYYSNDNSIEIKFGDDYQEILQDLSKGFTQYELEEFVRIRSTYAKTLYRLIKQWRTIGRSEYAASDLRYRLDVPDGYNNAEFKRRILDSAKKELAQYFVDFDFQVVKEKKRGNPVKSYIFTWTPEERSGETYDPNKYKKKTKKKAKKQESNIPEWSTLNNPDGFVNTTTEQEKEDMEKRKAELLASIDKLEKSDVKPKL